jgi:type II secretory pathway pseudopilin PulG
MRKKRLHSIQSAFSLVETLVATAIIVSIGAVAFQLFHQNERLFRDQSLVLEMQQSARVIVSQIDDDVRMAGQGIPPGLSEVILPGSGDSRLNVRASFSSVESVVVSALPLPVASGSALTVLVESVTGFSTGRQAFLWADLSWSRGTINSVSHAAGSIRLTPSSLSASPLEFVVPPAISLDEAVSLYWDSATKTMRRTTATNTENPESPVWAPANELATNVVGLTFFYFNAGGDAVIPDTPEHRSEIGSIEARVVVRTSASLSDGSRPAYALSTRTTPRNMRLRSNYFRAQ